MINSLDQIGWMAKKKITHDENGEPIAEESEKLPDIDEWVYPPTTI